MTVPAQTATLRIAADSLLELPPRAVYRARTGRAEAVVEREGADIIVYANCDSLQQRVDYYEERWNEASERADRYKDLYEREAKRGSNPFRTALWGFLAGLLAGIAITAAIIIKNIKDKEHGKK